MYAKAISQMMTSLCGRVSGIAYTSRPVSCSVIYVVQSSYTDINIHIHTHTLLQRITNLSHGSSQCILSVQMAVSNLQWCSSYRTHTYIHYTSSCRRFLSRISSYHKTRSLKALEHHLIKAYTLHLKEKLEYHYQVLHNNTASSANSFMYTYIHTYLLI